MNRLAVAGLLVITAECLGGSAVATGQPSDPVCNLKGSYGVQCHGTVFTGSVSEPVTYIGTVLTHDDGFVEGWATLNSSDGSLPTYVAGILGNPSSCAPQPLTYTTNWILLPNGSHIELPPLAVMAAPADGGREILGAGIVPPGVTGDLVPRLTCRLVRLQDVDIALALRMEDTGGHALTGAFTISQPTLGVVAAPATLNLEASQPFTITAPFMVGACTFTRFLNPDTGSWTTGRTLNGNYDSNQTRIAQYRCL